MPSGPIISPTWRQEWQDKILGWVDRCRTSHNCGHPGSPRLPPRVLDIGPAPESPLMLRELGEHMAQYNCLSHRWGDQQPLVTTSANLSTYMTQGIPWGHVPKTYRDAVDVTRLLGIRYIWIDSLCIIQDSKEDWEVQSSQMCQIYSNAFVTVAATSSQNCLAGFPISGSKCIQGTGRDGKPYHVFSHTAISHPIDLNSLKGQYDTNDNVDTTRWPLLTRAWVFQEKMLSPRILHFGKDEIIWECDADSWCECDWQGGVNDSFSLRRRFKSTLESDHAAMPEVWRRIVADYSRLAITKPSDRLPALSGIAQRILASKPSQKYLAGLWSDTLDMDLLWHSSSIEGSPVPNGGGCAPSWSWAGRAAYVEFPRCHVWGSSGKEYRSRGMIEKWFKLVNIQCSPATIDPTGQTTGGQLTLEAPCHATILRNIGDKQCKPETRWSLKQKAQGVRFPGADLFCDSPQNTRLYKVHETRVTCVRLALVERFADWDPHRMYGIEYVLVIVPSETHQGAYERVGMITVQRYFEMSGRRYSESASPFGGEGTLRTVDII